jgi:hypothetical protein
MLGVFLVCKNLAKKIPKICNQSFSNAVVSSFLGNLGGLEGRGSVPFPEMSTFPEHCK